MERTFAIIKPDAVKNGHAGRILARIEEAGFAVRALRMDPPVEARGRRVLRTCTGSGRFSVA